MSGSEVDCRSGHIGVIVVSVSELSVDVFSPAFCFVIIKDRAGVVATCGDGGGGASVAQVDGVSWGVGAVGTTVSKLTVVVEAPAFCFTVVEECARVVFTCGDGGCGASVAEVDGCSWCAVDVGVIVIAELTERVAAPAGDGAVVEECAGVSATGGDSGCGASVAEVNGVAWCVGVGGVAVTELTEKVISPAGDGAVVEECTGVLVADRNNRRDAASSEGNSGTWLIGIGGITDTKLTISIFSPTLHGAICC